VNPPASPDSADPASGSLSALFALARQQHYPPSALYVVATPIGNVADITVRALQVLHLADAVACEDTRHTARLLQACGVQAELLAVHEHNEARMAEVVLARLRAGQRIAYVSDAGTPGVSDPGARLCAAVQAAGLRTVPVPGASSVTALLSVAGVAEGAVTVVGFLPARGAARQRAWQRWRGLNSGLLLLEAPHRIDTLAEELRTFGARRLTVGRELTKQFEEVVTLPCADFAAWLNAAPQRRRGEFTLLIHPLATADHDAAHEALSPHAQHVLQLLLQELPAASAARLTSAITGAPRDALYRAALALRRDGHDPAA